VPQQGRSIVGAAVPTPLPLVVLRGFAQTSCN